MEKIRDFNKEERKRINLALWKERDVFYQKLRSKRHHRARLEEKAATLVQAAYRRYACNRYRFKREEMLRRRKQVRARIWSSLRSNKEMILSQKDNTNSLVKKKAFERIEEEKRKIQSEEKVKAEKEKVEREKLQQEQSAIAIQNTQRAKTASKVVERKRRQLEELTKKRMCMRIQGAWRAVLAYRRVSLRRRRLHYIASLMIQCRCRIALAQRRVETKRRAKTDT